MSGIGPTPAKNEAAPISLFVRCQAANSCLVPAYLIIPELAPHVVVETDHEQVEIARRERHRRDLLLLVVEHRLTRQWKPIAARGGGLSFHRPATAQNPAIRVNGSFPGGAAP